MTNAPSIPLSEPDMQPLKASIDHKTIHQAIIDIGDLQAQLDSLKITLYKSLNALRQQEN